MIDPDVLRQLAADLDAKVAEHLTYSAKYADQHDKSGVAYHNGRVDAYSDAAALVRGMLNETSKGEDHG